MKALDKCCRGWLRLFMTLLVLTLGHSLLAEISKNPEDAPWWQGLEDDLVEAGISADVPSLLIAVKSHKDEMIRWQATTLLGARDDRSAQSTLREVLNQDPSPFVRRGAAKALASWGDEQGLAAVKVLLSKSTTIQERLELGSLLAGQGDDSGFIYAKEAASAEAALSRVLAAEALPSFVRRQGGGEEAEDAIAILVRLAEDPSREVRSAALSGMFQAVRRGAPAERFRSSIKRMAESDPDQNLRLSAKYALPDLDIVEACWKTPENPRCK
jgi:HEAT repeat protein